MSNNTNYSCAPLGMNNGILMTDYRPSNSLYVNVYDNNKFREYLQKNGNKIRQQNLRQFETKNGCFSCEKQPKQIKKYRPGY